MNANELWPSPGEAMKPHETDAACSDWDIDPGRRGHLIDVLYGVGGRYSEAFYNIGITTVEQLASITDTEGLEEESAIRLYIAMKAIAGVFNWTRINGYVEAVQRMDRGEVLSWYSLRLKLGFKAIAGFRAAYS